MCSATARWMCRTFSISGSPKVHVGSELAEGAPGGPVTGAFPGFSLGVLVMGQGPVEARGKRAVFSKARWARLCVRGAGSFHRACPFVTSGPRGALLHLPRVQLVKSRCPYDLRCTCVIFQPERWGPNSRVYPGFPTIFRGLSGFFVGDLRKRPCGSSWKTRSVFQGAVGALCASTAPCVPGMLDSSEVQVLCPSLVETKS